MSICKQVYFWRKLKNLKPTLIPCLIKKSMWNHTESSHTTQPTSNCLPGKVACSDLWHVCWKGCLSWLISFLVSFFFFHFKNIIHIYVKLGKYRKKCILNAVSLGFLSAPRKHSIPALSHVHTQWTPGLLPHHSQRKLQYSAVQTLAWSVVSMSKLTWVTACDLTANFYTLTSSCFIVQTILCSSQGAGHFLFSRRRRRRVCKLSWFMCVLLSKLKISITRNFLLKIFVSVPLAWNAHVKHRWTALLKEELLKCEGWLSLRRNRGRILHTGCAAWVGASGSQASSGMSCTSRERMP